MVGDPQVVSRLRCDLLITFGEDTDSVGTVVETALHCLHTKYQSFASAEIYGGGRPAVTYENRWKVWEVAIDD